MLNRICKTWLQHAIVNHLKEINPTYSVVSNVYCWLMSVNCWVSVGLAVDLGALPICALNMEQNHSHFNLKI